MQVFKDEHDTKRVIFNIDARLAHRLERAKHKAKRHARKLNVDAIVDDALSRYLEEAERQLKTLARDQQESTGEPIVMESAETPEQLAETTALQVRAPSVPRAK